MGWWRIVTRVDDWNGVVNMGAFLIGPESYANFGGAG